MKYGMGPSGSYPWLRLLRLQPPALAHLQPAFLLQFSRPMGLWLPIFTPFPFSPPPLPLHLDSGLMPNWQFGCCLSPCPCLLDAEWAVWLPTPPLCITTFQYPPPPGAAHKQCLPAAPPQASRSSAQAALACFFLPAPAPAILRQRLPALPLQPPRKFINKNIFVLLCS